MTRRNLPTLSVGETTLQWERIATGHDGGTGWLHSGIAALPNGDLLIAHPEGHDLIRIPVSGHSVRIHTELTEMHCLTVGCGKNGEVRVWAADNGHRFVHGTPVYAEIRQPGRVVALHLDGSIAQELRQPAGFGPWSPTSVALVDASDPGSDIWVADGYGQSVIHRFAADGTLLDTLDGAESGAVFSCPHGMLIRAEGPEQVLYVADRSNTRIVVLTFDGTYIRTLGEGVLDSPSSMVDFHGHLVVTELFGALAVFVDDSYLGHLGSSGRDHQTRGWPNRVAEDGHTVAPRVIDGTFNSPHGITVYKDALYLTEWMIGGRAIRLAPVSA